MWRIVGCFSVVFVSLLSTAAHADLLLHDQGDLGIRVEEVKIVSTNDQFIF